MKKHLKLLSLFNVFFLANLLQAQVEEGFEYILSNEVPIVSASFFKTNQSKAPGSSVVIDSTVLQNSPARNLADLIEENVLSMTVFQGELFGPSICARGNAESGGAVRTLVMLDGQAINHCQGYGYSNEYASPLLGDIKSIEVITGPGAIVHGSGALTGFVNLQPKNGTDNPGFFTNASYGSVENLKSLETGYGMKFDEGKDLYLYAGAVQAEGVPIDRNVWQSPTLRLKDDSRARSWNSDKNKAQGFPDPSYKIAGYLNLGNFSLNTFLQETNTQPNGVYPDYNDGNEPISSALFGFHPKYTLNFNEEDSLDISMALDGGELGLTRFLFDQQTMSSTKTRFNGVESHEELKMVGKTTRFRDQSTALGVLYGGRDFRAGKSFLHPDPDMGFGTTGSWKELAVFGEDVWQIFESQVASLGFRYDKVYYGDFESSRAQAWRPTSYAWSSWETVPNTPWSYNLKPANQDNFSYRFAFAHNISESLVAKLSYQTGFRYPDAGAFESHAYFSKELQLAGYAPLPDLKPEKMKSTEFNLNKNFEEIKVRVDTSIYYNVYENFLNWWQRNDPVWTTQWFEGTPRDVAALYGWPRFNWWMGSTANSLGTFKSIGSEISATWMPETMTVIKLGYAYSQPYEYSEGSYSSGGKIVTTDRKEWIRYPSHQVKGSISSDFFDKTLNVSLFMLFSTGFPVAESGGLLSPIYDKNRFVSDVAVTYYFTKDFSAELTVKNMFGNDVPRMTSYGEPYAGAAGQEKTYWYLSLHFAL